MPNSYHAAIRQQTLWQTNFASTSFRCAVSVRLRTLSPNFRLTALNVYSTLLRRW